MSTRSVTPHLRGLEETGYLRSRERNRGGQGRAQTTLRWVNSRRILVEAERIREAFRVEQEAKYGPAVEADPFQQSLELREEESSPLTLREEVGDALRGSSPHLEGKLTSFRGEAASLVTVKEPSIEPSDQPSTRASARNVQEELDSEWIAKTGHPAPRR